MRVLYCTDTYPPQVNGVSVVTALSVQGLKRRGWECAVIAPTYPEEAYDSFGRHSAHDVDVIHSLFSVPMPTYPSIRLAMPSYLAVLRAVRNFRPDIIHCATEFVTGRLGQIAARATHTPLVTSYHTDFGKYAHAYGFPLLGSQVTSYITRFHQRARCTYTPSRPARDDLHRIGVKHAQVWGCGVDTETFHPNRKTAELRARLALSPDTFLFVHVGRLAREKSVHVMLDAYRIVRERLPGRRLHFVIAGTGPCESELRKRAPEGTTFIGHLDRQTSLPALYASSDAFLFSSLTETLGLVVLEAMSSGLPVVAAPMGGVEDHLHDDLNGLSYPALDAGAMASQMVRLAVDRVLRNRLAVGARCTAEPLSWEHELDRLDASYRNVVLSHEAVNSESVLYAR